MHILISKKYHNGGKQERITQSDLLRDARQPQSTVEIWVNIAEQQADRLRKPHHRNCKIVTLQLAAESGIPHDDAAERCNQTAQNHCQDERHTKIFAKNGGKICPDAHKARMPQRKQTGVSC